MNFSLLAFPILLAQYIQYYMPLFLTLSHSRERLVCLIHRAPLSDSLLVASQSRLRLRTYSFARENACSRRRVAKNVGSRFQSFSTSPFAFLGVSPLAGRAYEFCQIFILFYFILFLLFLFFFFIIVIIIFHLFSLSFLFKFIIIVIIIIFHLFFIFFNLFLFLLFLIFF